MVKRILLYGSVAATMIIIFLFSASTNYFKKPFSPDEDVQLYITNLNKMVDRQDWAEADGELKYLENAWVKVRKRIQFTGEEDDIKRINEALFKLQALLRIKDVPGIKRELAIIEFGWQDIGK